MTLLKTIVGIASSLATVALASWIAGPPDPQLVPREVTRDSAPEGLAYEARLAAEKPEVVIMGNSIMDCAVDVPEFQRAMGLPTSNIAIGGSATAIWYLQIKNFVSRAEPAPKLVVLGFRDVYLTVPWYRTTGGYAQTIGHLVEHDEPLLDRRAYLHELGDLDVFLRRHWSLHQKRAELRADAEDWFKRDLSGLLVGRSADEMSAAVDRVFDESNKLEAAVTAAQQKAEQSFDERLFDFDHQLPRSFLPEIVELLEERGIQLVLVQLPLRRNAEFPEDRSSFPFWVDELLPDYHAKLRAYLAEQGVGLVDLSDDPRVPFEWFARGDHLSPELGMPNFTPIFVEALRPYVDAIR